MRLFLATSLFVLAATATGQQIVGTYRNNDVPGLRNAVVQSPENAGLRVRLAQALLRRTPETAHPDAAARHLTEAQEQFRQTLALNPRAVVPLRVMALDSYRTRNLEGAIQFGQRFLELVPTDSEVSRHVIKAMVRLGRLEQAADALLGLMRTHNTAGYGAFQGLLSTLLLNKDFQSLMAPRMEALKNEAPNDPFFLMYRAMYLMEVGRLEASWGELHQAEALGLCDHITAARHPLVHALSARAPEFERSTAFYDGQEVAELKKRVAEHSKHAGLLMRLARLLDLSGDEADAIVGYRGVVLLSPKYWPATYRLAILQAKSKRHSEAAQAYAQTRALNPLLTSLAIQEALSLIESGKIPEGLRLVCEGAAQQEPGPATEQLLEALKGRGPDAVQQLVVELQKAAAASPQNPYLWAHLALALARKTQVQEARAQALKAERCGLVGVDGYPSPVLYGVFGESLPEALTPPKR